VAVVLIVVVASGIYLGSKLSTSIESFIDNELLRHARSARSLIEQHTGPMEIDLVDPLADRLGNAVSARITVIADDGVVLGDSELSLDQVRVIENHGKRPEVLQAIAENQGLSRRYSTTLETWMEYVAVPYRRGEDRGVIRASRPLHEVDRAASALRFLLIITGVLGIGLALVMSILASHFMSRPLRRVVKSARALAEGTSQTRIPVPSEDELGGLAFSINRLSLELQRLVNTLAEERDRFEAVLEGMDEGVLALDGKHRITHINHSALALLGLADEPLGQSLLETVRIPGLQELAANAGAGTRGSLEFDLAGKNPRRILAHATPQRATGGTVVVIQDVTELRRLERVRQDFIANVSHELRTPVSVIRANSETLLNGALEDRNEAQKFLEALQRNAERLSNLIADLLDISRIESGRYPTELKSVSVAAAVRYVLEAFEKDSKDKNLSMLADVDEGLRVLADEKALGQILSNLVDNAVKYTPAGGQVTIQARKDGEQVRIEVRDTGLGIELRHRDRIFERFYRVDTGRSREMGGTGLGLSIVKNLTEAMHGRVGLELNSPKGSTFFVILPPAEKPA
jgi:two-component system phosphate regulon sensor histidine kinase PhoR